MTLVKLIFFGGKKDSQYRARNTKLFCDNKTGANIISRVFSRTVLKKGDTFYYIQYSHVIMLFLLWL